MTTRNNLFQRKLCCWNNWRISIRRKGRIRKEWCSNNLCEFKIMNRIVVRMKKLTFDSFRSIWVIIFYNVFNFQCHSTGGSFNPARSLGPAIWNADFDFHWVRVFINSEFLEIFIIFFLLNSQEMNEFSLKIHRNLEPIPFHENAVFKEKTYKFWFLEIFSVLIR